MTEINELMRSLKQINYDLFVIAHERNHFVDTHDTPLK